MQGNLGSSAQMKTLRAKRKIGKPWKVFTDFQIASTEK